MKRRLNLFSKRTSSEKIVSYYTLARRIVLWIFGISFIVLISLGGGYIYFSQQLESVNKSKDSYNRYILLNQSFSREIQKFVFKYTTVQNYIAEDAKSFVYYSKLLDIFEQTQAVEELDSFSINSQRYTTIGVNFANYNDALSFIESLETSLFSDNFEKMSIGGFNIVEQNQEGYKLSLEGVFIPINKNGSNEN